MDRILFPLLTEEDKKLPFILKSVGVRGNQEHIVRPEGYPDYHWLHCAKGKGNLRIAEKEYVIIEGTGFFLVPAVPHEYFATEEPWETHWITFEGHAASSVLEILNLNNWGVYHLNNRHTLERTLENIYHSGKSRNISRSLDCSVLLYQLLVQLKHCISTDTSRSKPAGQYQLQPVIQYIEENFSKSISLDEMAQVISVTPQHLCRLFKQSHGTRPFDYLTRYRLQKAKELLISPAAPSVKSVSMEVGYNDTSYFCSIFKEYEGITPTEFRNMYCSIQP
ncbi:MAG: AraC family transcriptional regulator [Clostridia bacterium]|nr:AraC family transcriptional regulator [Clostridia bacterium]